MRKYISFVGVALLLLSLGTACTGDSTTPSEVPCVEDRFAGCLEAQSELDSLATDSCLGSGFEVCLVPMGQVDPDLVKHLLDHFDEEYGLSVGLLTPLAIPEDLESRRGDQMLVHEMLAEINGAFPQERGRVLRLGITPVDLHDDHPHMSSTKRFVFGLRGDHLNPFGMISTFRMDPRTYGESPDDGVLFSRARKLVSKYIGLIHYVLPPSTDPESPMYDSILGVDDLDRMGEPLPLGE